MSPELINGHQYDAKSDIWALGCLIFELCSWHPPFAQATTQPELTALIREGKIPALPQGYSTALSQVVRSMLRQDPKQRPTAKQILGHDYVKFQIKGIKLRRIHDALMVERTGLEARERALAQREQALAQKEQALREREAALSAREQQVALYEEEKDQVYQILRGPSCPPTTAGSIGGSSLSNSTRSGSSLLNEEDDEYDTDRQAPTSISSGASMGSSGNSEQGEVIKRVASRPSLVPRRGPQEERRSM